MTKSESTKRDRGTGSIFRNGSDVWWIKFYERGIARRESTQSTDYAVAEKLLKKRLAEVETQTYIPQNNIRVDDLVEDLMAEYREKQQRSIKSVEQRWRLHLAPFFRKRKASNVTTDMIRRYIKQRTDELASPASVNRELAILKRSFNLGMESTPPKVRLVPYIPMFEEKNVRTGFLADQDHSKLAAECSKKGLWLRGMLSVGYNYGWRAGEILAMRVGQVDLADRTIRLEVGMTKNGRGRVAKLTQETYTLLQACMINKEPDDHLFTRQGGSAVLDFRGAWQGACVRSGLGKFVCLDCDEVVTKRKCTCGSRRRKYVGLLFHDLRRTGVRNLRRLGVAESVAMKISGHKTASVFRRYDIVEQADLADAAARLDAKQKAQATPESQSGQSLGRTIQNSTQKSEASDQQMTADVLPN